MHWNTIVCALRKSPGVILAQLPLSKTIPGHGSEGVKSQGLFPVSSLAARALKLKTLPCCHGHGMVYTANDTKAGIGAGEDKEIKSKTKTKTHTHTPPLLFTYYKAPDLLNSVLT